MRWVMQSPYHGSSRFSRSSVTCRGQVADGETSGHDGASSARLMSTQAMAKSHHGAQDFGVQSVARRSPAPPHGVYLNGCVRRGGGEKPLEEGPTSAASTVERARRCQ